jgi:hypothetical protein
LRRFCVHALHRNIRWKRALGANGGPQAAVGGHPQKGATLRVFVLGGTGLIGSAVVQKLVGRGHQLFGLAWSGASAARLDQFGVTPITVDIGAPAHLDPEAGIHPPAQN